jgi:hypothetical protein
MYSGVSGKVGIGIGAPTSKLEVRESTTNRIALKVQHDGSTIAPVVDIERVGLPGPGDELLKMIVPAGSSHDGRFVEFDRGTTTEFAIDTDGYITSNGGAWFEGNVNVDGMTTLSNVLNVDGSSEIQAQVTSSYLSASTHVLEVASTATGSADVMAIYGESVPQDYYGIGGYFKGGYIGAEGSVFPTGSGHYTGVLGSVHGGTGTNYAVYGNASGAGTNWAGYFNGDVNITGNLTGGSPVYRIDHPVDPEGMYLQHAGVESDEMLNIYNGNVALDGRGEATVEMPGWFEELNRDFRYQLTCIGGFAPVYIAETIQGNSFRIAGGEPGMVVSWQVTGVRSDPYSRANSVAVEVAKAADEVGRYVHPTAFGGSPTEAIGFREPGERD